MIVSVQVDGLELLPSEYKIKGNTITFTGTYDGRRKHRISIADDRACVLVYNTAHVKGKGKMNKPIKYKR